MEELEKTQELSVLEDLPIDDKGVVQLNKTKITDFGLAELNAFATAAKPAEGEEVKLTEMEYNILKWACCHLAPCFRSVKEYGVEVLRRPEKVLVTDVVTVSDMAFMVLILQNNWELYKSVGTHRYKLAGSKLSKVTKKEIEEKQKKGEVHKVSKGAKRYHDLVCYIHLALLNKRDLHEQLDNDFSDFCLDKHGDNDTPLPALDAKEDESNLAYYDLMFAQI